MNWGKGLVVAISLFMLFILGLSFYMMSQQQELETEDYYEKDLTYQQEMEARTNASSLAHPIQFAYTPEEQHATIELSVNQPVAGTIRFTRPSDASLDFDVPLVLDSVGHQTIATDSLTKGLWHVQASWQMNNKTYQSPQWEIVK
jgi:hypothetical protein